MREAAEQPWPPSEDTGEQDPLPPVPVGDPLDDDEEGAEVTVLRGYN